MTFQDFVGKTITAVNDECVNAVTFYFSDGTKQTVYAECGTTFTSIPFFDFQNYE